MHHLYPLAKGDPLCPLGFHPQVRWPTRCKRCFRDYKEHGGRKKEEDMTVSTPSLSTWNSPSSRPRDKESSPSSESSVTMSVRGWVSSQNLSQEPPKNDKTDPFSAGFGRPSATWTSTPDLGNLNDDTRAVTVSLTLPRRRPTPPDTGQNTETQSVVILRRPSGTPPPPPSHLVINKNDSLAERVRKMQALKAHSNSFDKESSSERERDAVKKVDSFKEKKSEIIDKTDYIPKAAVNSKDNDVNFLIKVKNARKNVTRPPLRGGPAKEMVNGIASKDKEKEKDRDFYSDRDDSDSNQEDDAVSNAGTSTTETTLVDHHNLQYQEEIQSLKGEVDTLRKRCEKVEKEKSDILLRRLASLDTSSTKTSSRPSELLKLQQKVNELNMQNEDLRDEKKCLQLKVRDAEAELEARPSTEAAARSAEQLRSKLLAAETLCEELMDENEDMKRELRSMEEEIEEMQDNFREDQADEYSSLRKELELTTKNCRVLSFKLKKTERKSEQLEQDKKEHEKKLLELAGGAAGMDRVAKIKDLERDLALSNEVALRLQRELQEANSKLVAQKRAPALAAIGKSPSADTKPSRASLTRGGSQEDPQQLLRDLQDSLEREADLREQLKNAEEEGVNLRKKASRVEDDNESLVLQLKKMATKARTRKLSPTPPAIRLSADDKDEGISDEEDPAELRILLELNEQEASVLRRKVEELEREGESMKTQLKDVTEKLAVANVKPAPLAAKKLANAKVPNISEEKIKILEDNIDDLRKKLIEKERDCERLHAELSLTQKRSKGSLIKSKSLDGANEQQNVDLKRQLQLIEQEASVLTSKTQTLETENEKLLAENKKLQLLRGAKILKSDKSFEQSTEKISQLETELQEALGKVKELEVAAVKEAEKPEKKVTFGLSTAKKDAEALKTKQDELDKMKLTMKKVETEKDRLTETLKQLKDEAAKTFKPRTPKKPTDFTTKLQLKKMVEELESEIGEMFVVMKNADLNSSEQKQQEKVSLEKSLEELKKKLGSSETELSTEKTRLQSEIKKLSDLNAKYETEKKSLAEKQSACEKDRDHALENYKSMIENNKKLDAQIAKLNTDLKSASSKQTAMADCMKKIEELKQELDDKDKQVEKLKKDLDNAAKTEQDKSKLLKEVGDKSKKITELEKKLKESDDKCKRTEKMLSVRKERVAKLEQEEESLGDSTGKAGENSVSRVEFAQIKEKLDTAQRETAIKEQEISAVRQDLLSRQQEVAKLQEEMAAGKQETLKLQQDKKELENSLKSQTKETAHMEGKVSELEIDFQAERKRGERMKVIHEKDVKNKEIELAALKGKLRTLEQTSGAGSKKITELKKEYEDKFKKLENDLAAEKKEYEELTGKYEILEEEHVVTKAKLTIDKESAQGEVLQSQRELAKVTTELKSLQDTYNAKTDAWIKDKMELQDKLSSLEERLCGGGWEVEKARLTARLDQKEREVGHLTKERDVSNHLQEALKRETDELRQKFDDFDKVTKIQRNLTQENANMEKEMKTLQNKITLSEKSKKSEVAECRMRYESQMQSIQDQLQSVQGQVSRFKRERDMYKQMYDTAHKTMSDMRTGSGDPIIRNNRASISSIDEEETKSKIANLQQQVACLEDGLCEARLEASKARTELVSERSTAEVRLSEMQSKVNEFEEERLVASGRTKIPGLRTRLELAWHKERDDQQRLLQETSTLARDLRQTLFEVERERDKEKLDMKRRIDQLKKGAEEETDENKKKVTELQCDLLELRDAHAKLRTTNEKLRREKERHDKDREQHKMSMAAIKRSQQDEDRKVSYLLEVIDELNKMTPEGIARSSQDHLGPNNVNYMTPTPPRRNRSSKSRSREATPDDGTGEGGANYTLARLHQAAKDVRAMQLSDRQRRQANMRRAASTEPRETIVATVSPRSTNGRMPSLKKRSISLEQTTHDQSRIWKTDEDSMSSLQSLDTDLNDTRPFSMTRDSSLDSRLSGGSTQSEILPVGDKKKKKGIFGKLKQLTKSRSIDDNAASDDFMPIGYVPQGGSDSDMSTSGSKKDLKGRLSDMFSRKGGAGSSSSSIGKEKRKELSTPVASRTDSHQRPLSRNGSSSQIASIPTASTITTAAAKSDSGIQSRSQSVTPGLQRKKK